MHLAGAFEDGVQHCVMCGKVLCDYRNAMIPDGQPTPKGWPKGEVYQLGNMTQTDQPEEYTACILMDTK